MTARTLHFLLALTISIGLAIAPLVSPAVAAMHQAGDADEMHDMMQMAGTSGDMPCCPDKQKQSDCQDCPLLAICMAKMLQNAPAANGLPFHEGKSRTLRPLDEPVLAGLMRPPPDQPPRTLV
jgi:hypothetical protein